VAALLLQGYTALIWSSRNGHGDISTMLVANGADVNAKDNQVSRQ
jgi:ankyrin repeat protein